MCEINLSQFFLFSLHILNKQMSNSIYLNQKGKDRVPMAALNELSNYENIKSTSDKL